MAKSSHDFSARSDDRLICRECGEGEGWHAKPSDLEELVEAAEASDHDIETDHVFYSAVKGSYYCEGCMAKETISGLAPALARKVLDLREAGGVLAEAMEEYERMWETANACPECVGSLCADHALKLTLARTKAVDASAAWAKLTETEVRHG